MLADCLKSIAANDEPLGASLSIVVIDNDASGSARQTIDRFCELSGRNLTYVIEPRRGLSAVRNAAVNVALSDGANFIAFTDDDCVVAPNWIAAIYSKLRETGAAWVKGDTFSGRPDEKNAIRPAGGYWRMRLRLWFRELVPSVKAGTGNVIISAELFTRYGLWFDNDFNLSGGEDSHFFRCAARNGLFGRFCPNALVFENFRLERFRFKNRFLSFRASSAGTVLSYAKILGNWIRPFFFLWSFPLILCGFLFKSVATAGSTVGAGAIAELCDRVGSKWLGRGCGYLLGSLGFRYDFYSSS